MYDNDRVKKINTPLQRSGQDEVIQEWEFGGPSCNRDVRLILHADTLGHLLDIARSSKTRRVVLNGAGFRVRVRRAKTGHVYETLHVTGSQPIPEVVPSSLKVPISVQAAERLILTQGKK